MVPKIENCYYALENGVSNIFIGDHNIIKSTEDCTKISFMMNELTNNAIQLLQDLIKIESYSFQRE